MNLLGIRYTINRNFYTEAAALAVRPFNMCEKEVTHVDDDMIRALIAMDQRARKLVQAEKDRRSAAKAEIAQEKQQLADSYQRHAQEYIQKMREKADRKNARQLTQAEENFRQVEASLEKQYQQNKERWIRELVDRCI